MPGLPRQPVHPARPRRRPQGVRDRDRAVPAGPLRADRQPLRVRHRRRADGPALPEHRLARGCPPGPGLHRREPPPRQLAARAPPRCSATSARTRPSGSTGSSPGWAPRLPADPVLPARADAARALEVPAGRPFLRRPGRQAGQRGGSLAGGAHPAQPPTAPAAGRLHRPAARRAAGAAPGCRAVRQGAGGRHRRPRLRVQPGRQVPPARRRHRPDPALGADVHQGAGPDQGPGRRPQLGARRPAADRRRHGRPDGPLEGRRVLRDRPAPPPPERQVVVRGPGWRRVVPGPRTSGRSSAGSPTPWSTRTRTATRASTSSAARRTGCTGHPGRSAGSAGRRWPPA